MRASPINPWKPESNGHRASPASAIVGRMSCQFRVYLLPDDVEWLIAELRTRFDFRLLQESSKTATPVELHSPLRVWPATSRGNAHTDVRGYLATRADADLRQWYAANRSEWLLAVESEIVEFSGCDFDGASLSEGRFCFQTDQLAADTIVPKRAEFLSWADRLFRGAKKLLTRSRTLDAYLGPRTAKWLRDGGQLAASAGKSGVGSDAPGL